MIQISSSSNDYFKRWLSLSSSKGLRQEGEFILMGEKLVREFLSAPLNGFQVRAEIVPAGGKPLLPAKSKIFEVSAPLFKELDVVGTKFNLLVLSVPEFSKPSSLPAPRGLELVCPLGDPTNLGAVIRSAVAFGVSQVLLTEEACHPFHPKAVKSSAGAVLKMPFLKIGPLKNYVSTGVSYALDMNGQDLSTLKWPKDLRLILGEEGPGLPALDGVQKISISTNKVESLNATVAASLAFYSYRSQNKI